MASTTLTILGRGRPARRRLRALLLAPSRLDCLREGRIPSAASVTASTRLCESLSCELRNGAFDVVFVSEQLADPSWREAVARVRSLRPEARIIVCAPRPTLLFFCEALTEGADDVLVTPVRKGEAWALIQAAVAESPSRGNPPSAVLQSV